MNRKIISHAIGGAVMTIVVITLSFIMPQQISPRLGDYLSMLAGAWIVAGAYGYIIGR